MSRSLIAFYVGSAALALYGVGHTLGYSKDRRTDRGKDYVRVLKETPAAMPGVTRTYLHLFEGYSWMMALMVFAYGLLNVLLAWVAPQVASTSRAIAGLDLAVSFAAAGLAKRYFFGAPLLLSLVAGVSFLLVLLWAAS